MSVVRSVGLNRQFETNASRLFGPKIMEEIRNGNPPEGGVTWEGYKTLGSECFFVI